MSNQKKNNVAIIRISEYLEARDKELLNAAFNRWSWLNKQNYESKKIVSFYDDDKEFMLSVSVPYSEDNHEFDHNMLDLQDYLGEYCGVTWTKIDKEWL